MVYSYLVQRIIQSPLIPLGHLFLLEGNMVVVFLQLTEIFF